MKDTNKLTYCHVHTRTHTQTHTRTHTHTHTHTTRRQETHRQAEQRRRLQQIEAASELKKVLRMHDGTPLGVTLQYAAEHIHELRKSEMSMVKEIDRQKHLNGELRSQLGLGANDNIAEHTAL